MIIYSKRLWGLPLAIRVQGSAFPRSFVFALMSGLAAAAFHHWARESIQDAWEHPYPFAAFASVVGFILVFRINNSYNRYWQARLEVQHISSKLVDTVSFLLAFDEMTDQGGSNNRLLFRRRMVHLVSLLHALTFQQLRCESNVDNLAAHGVRGSPLPPGQLDAARRSHGRFSWLKLQTGSRAAEVLHDITPISVIGGVSSAEKAVLSNVGWQREGQRLPANGEGVWMVGEKATLVSNWLTTLLFRRRHEIGKP
mmetsp:Transcript_6724/g.23459  ORF Transcript_6724/g.23459 Transcript_6724/m.23459 type:complete len:254 (-) Transcript_6724:50-811(-)